MTQLESTALSRFEKRIPMGFEARHRSRRAGCPYLTSRQAPHCPIAHRTTVGTLQTRTGRYWFPTIGERTDIGRWACIWCEPSDGILGDERIGTCLV
jgi:hypothetical protein